MVSNLRRLRSAAGITGQELGERAGMGRQGAVHHEGISARELTTIKAVKVAHSLGASVDQLIEGIYWNRGEIARRPEDRQPQSERLAGFFLVLPESEPELDPPPPREPVANRHEAAMIFGQNVRGARERRHLTQEALAPGAGLSREGLSLIERGVRETTIEKLLALARALEVTPDFLLGGIAWRPKLPVCDPPNRGGAQLHTPGSLDAPIKELWRQRRTAPEIAEIVGTSPGGVGAVVHRLRERGEPLPYRSPPTRDVHEGARRRRATRRPMRAGQETQAQEETDEVGELEVASRADVAARIGNNIAFHRRQAGLSQAQLGEAAESSANYLSHMERGASTPKLGGMVRLAASFNIRCELLTAGIVWRPDLGAFLVEEVAEDDVPARQRIGQIALEARRRLGISQQSLGERAEMSRSDLVDFEHGKRNFRIFTLVRLAGALEVDFAELLAGIVDWYVRPLPAPEFEPGELPTKAERDAVLARLWRAGRPEQQIAEALDLKVSSVGPYVRELRDAGVDLPYRRSPRRANEAAARRRRGARRGDRCGSADPGRAPARR